MKILIIGSDYNWSIERLYKRELLKLGHEVIHVPVQNWFYDFYYKSTMHKALVRLGLTRLQTNIQKRFLAELKGQFFDLIWVFKGMELTPQTVQIIKLQTTRLINFNPDNPFIFSGKGSGNNNITKSIHLYDEHFTYDHEVKSRIESEFGIKCTLVPFGFDNEVISNEELNEVEEIKAACFVGNPDTIRSSIIKSLLEQNIKVHLYGNNWSNFIRHPLAVIHQPVYGLDLYQTLRKYRVQLNIMRVHNLDSHNMRSMEIPGVGGVMLAPQTQDHVAFYDLDKEIFIYSDNSSLAQQAKHILNMEKYEIECIRKRARNKVLQQFTYSIQTKHILSLLNEA